MRHQAGHRGLPLVPVTHTMGMRPFSPGGKSVSTMASPTAGARPLRVPVHGQSRPGVDLNYDCRPGLPAAVRCRLPPTSSPATSRPDDLGRQRGVGRGAGMNLIGHVDGQVVAVLNHH